MPLNLEIITEIIRCGTAKFPSMTDPSESEILQKAGVATVTAHLEGLSLYELVRDVHPIFGKNGGMWIGYSVSDKGYKCGTDENYFRQIIASCEEKPINEVSQSVTDLAEKCNNTDINPSYKEDFIKTLQEVSICFQHECFIATIALCGKILEVCLKEMLIRHGSDAEGTFMLGPLIRKIRTDIPQEYLDPALENISKVISFSRNTAIHYGNRVPIPSRDQAVMVIFATRDVVIRNITNTPKNTKS